MNSIWWGVLRFIKRGGLEPTSNNLDYWQWASHFHLDQILDWIDTIWGQTQYIFIYCTSRFTHVCYKNIAMATKRNRPSCNSPKVSVGNSGVSQTSKGRFFFCFKRWDLEDKPFRVTLSNICRKNIVVHRLVVSVLTEIIYKNEWSDIVP